MHTWSNVTVFTDGTANKSDYFTGNVNLRENVTNKLVCSVWPPWQKAARYLDTWIESMMILSSLSCLSSLVMSSDTISSSVSHSYVKDVHRLRGSLSELLLDLEGCVSSYSFSLIALTSRSISDAQEIFLLFSIQDTVTSKHTLAKLVLVFNKSLRRHFRGLRINKKSTKTKQLEHIMSNNETNFSRQQ